MAQKILIVEDEKDIRDLLQHYLKREGYQVETAESGEVGLRKAIEKNVDLILLDLMLPQMDGLEVCRALRSNPRTSSIPVIMVTAKGEEADRIVGLEIGADDYIPKPFSPREVIARVKARLRRLEMAKAPETLYRFGPITLDSERYVVTHDGKAQTLTAKEFKLLQFLIQNKGRVLSRDVLLNEVWGYDYFGTTRTVDVHVARLRQKLPFLNQTLMAIKGLGYKLHEPEEKNAP
jgi:two-component system alkaline phosphatase synthesis response regulator PhoP